MKRIIALIGVFSVLGGAMSIQGQEGDAGAALTTDEEKTSYALGLQIGASFKRDGIELKDEQFLAGVTDSYEGKEPQISQEDMMAVMQALQAKMQAKAMEAQAAAAAAGPENQAAGQAFLDENSKKEGVTTTESGLQYEVLETGDGEKPTAANTVKVHYHGTLIDGTVFDSSVERGQPTTFPLGGVIPGWTEGLQLMPVGSKYRLYVPSDLAYGERSPSPTIGPNSTLIFDVELLEIVE
ncbi:MAG: FKBP-type peptidyl-prolyl cis-trans isomerase [Verrucomicrobiota bacterium]